MTTHFQLTVGYDESKPEWGVAITSEGQHNAFVRPSLELAMKEATIRMKRREKFTRKFPVSQIIAPDGARQRLVTPNGD